MCLDRPTGIGEFGIRLAAAVLLDAFIVRTLLVPSLTHLFGNTNWWLPAWLEAKLPHLAIEPTLERPAQPSRSLTRENPRSKVAV